MTDTTIEPSADESTEAKITRAKPEKIKWQPIIAPPFLSFHLVGAAISAVIGFIVTWTAFPHQYPFQPYQWPDAVTLAWGSAFITLAIALFWERRYQLAVWRQERAARATEELLAVLRSR